MTAGLEVGVFQRQQPVGEEPEVESDAGHDAAAVRPQERAVVGGLDLCELLEPGLDAVGDSVQDPGTLGAGRRRPAGEGGPGCCDGRVDLDLRSAGNLGEDAFVDRGDVGEGLG